MRLLVTGGAGYIGSIVAQQVLARGDDVTVLDSLYRGHRAAVPEGAAFVEADLLDAAAFFETLNSTNRYSILYRLHDAKRPETRARRLEQFVAMLERGETLY